MHGQLLWLWLWLGLCSCLHVDPHVDPECSPGSRRQVAGAEAKLGQATIQLTKYAHTPLAHFTCCFLAAHCWYGTRLSRAGTTLPWEGERLCGGGRGCTKSNGDCIQGLAAAYIMQRLYHGKRYVYLSEGRAERFRCATSAVRKSKVNQVKRQANCI